MALGEGFSGISGGFGNIQKMIGGGIPKASGAMKAPKMTGIKTPKGAKLPKAAGIGKGPSLSSKRGVLSGLLKMPKLK